MNESDEFASLYTKLREIAQSSLRRNGPHLTISPTTVLHNVYLNLCQRDSLRFPDRSHFMAYASRAMRGLIIDYARERRTRKRGGEFEFVALSTDVEQAPTTEAHLLALSAALDELALIDASLAELVDLKFFCGFNFAEIAAMRSVSERTVRREWSKARLLLHRELEGNL